MNQDLLAKQRSAPSGMTLPYSEDSANVACDDYRTATYWHLHIKGPQWEFARGS